MGLKDSVFWSSWYITYFVMFTVSTFLVVWVVSVVCFHKRTTFLKMSLVLGAGVYAQ